MPKRQVLLTRCHCGAIGTNAMPQEHKSEHCWQKRNMTKSLKRRWQRVTKTDFPICRLERGKRWIRSWKMSKGLGIQPETRCVEWGKRELFPNCRRIPEMGTEILQRTYLSGFFHSA